MSHDDPRAGPVDAAGGGTNGPVWGVASDDLNATLLAWPPGTPLPEHVNDEVDVLLVMLSGSGTCTVDGRAEALGPSSVRLIPKGARRAIVAGADGMRYLSVHRRRGPLQIT
jgi:quercetin dioxygenase-like cupin family protein